MKSFIERARKKAKKSPGRYKVSALGFDKKGKYLGSTFNYLRFNRYGGGMHAEMYLLHKYGTRLKTVMIARVNNDGKFLPIHACSKCRKVLDKMGVKVVLAKNIVGEDNEQNQKVTSISRKR